MRSALEEAEMEDTRAVETIKEPRRERWITPREGKNLPWFIWTVQLMIN